MEGRSGVRLVCKVGAVLGLAGESGMGLCE
jgi:ABC-type dipeptide/oligopeptide/nickel transport system ATPase subunit